MHCAVTLLLFVLAKKTAHILKFRLDVPCGRKSAMRGVVPLLICLDQRQTARLTRRDVWKERATLRFGPELHGSKSANHQSVRRVVGESLVVV